MPRLICPHCHNPIIGEQQVPARFSAKLVRWSEHPVLSKPLIIRGMLPGDGSPARVDMSVGDRLRQRAAMGGERERAELSAFETLLVQTLASALVAEFRKDAEAQEVNRGAEPSSPPDNGESTR